MVAMPDPHSELTQRRRRLVIANWKMNGTLAQLRPLLTALQAGLPAAGSAEVVLCPPALYLAELAATDFALGAQDVSAHLEGAHTGELSVAMLKDYNCRLVILGHSERRQGQQESDETVALKCSAALEAGLVPVLCVGERAAEDTEKVVIRQLDAVLARCGQDLVQRGVIAYEPVWAIGTGRSASPEHAGGRTCIDSAETESGRCDCSAGHTHRLWRQRQPGEYQSAAGHRGDRRSTGGGRLPEGGCLHIHLYCRGGGHMLILQSLLVIAQGVIAVAMIALILLQHGRGADAGASFGSGSSSTVFGSRGPANLLSRTTAILAVLFVVNSLTLSWLAREQAFSGGIMQTLQATTEQADDDAAAVPEVPDSDTGAALELPAVPSLPAEGADAGAAEADGMAADATTGESEESGEVLHFTVPGPDAADDTAARAAETDAMAPDEAVTMPEEGGSQQSAGDAAAP